MLTVREYFRISNYILLSFALTLILSLAFPKSSTATEKQLNFDEFVLREKGKEITGLEGEHHSVNEKSNAEKYKIELFVGQVSVFALALLGVVYLHYSRNKYGTPYYNNEEIEFTETEITEFLDGVTPIEASAIITPNQFSADDLIISIFDLIERGFLYVAEVKSGHETRIYIDSSWLSGKHTLQNHEFFLINWLFIKIGDNEYFSSKLLREYVKIKSCAADFDIDYDIWLDELSEYVDHNNIMDRAVDHWRFRCAVIGGLFSVMGIILLYSTNSSSAIFLFLLTFLMHKIPSGVERRSRRSELDYKKLIICKRCMERDMENCACEGTEKWSKYFVYSIPFNNVNSVLSKFKHAELYEELKTEFEYAIKLARNTVRSLLDD